MDASRNLELFINKPITRKQSHCSRSHALHTHHVHHRSSQPTLRISAGIDNHIRLFRGKSRDERESTSAHFDASGLAVRVAGRNDDKAKGYKLFHFDTLRLKTGAKVRFFFLKTSYGFFQLVFNGQNPYQHRLVQT